MAIKYYCDGCDSEVPYDDIQKLTINIQVAGRVTSTGGQYELCKKCSEEVIRDCNPSQWPRTAKPATAA